MGGGGGKGDSDTVFHWAPYLEDEHESLIEHGWTYFGQIMQDHPSSPWATLTISDPDLAFLGTGYVISQFPSLYDMFGKFNAGLDVELLWSQIYEDTVNNVVTNDVITAEDTRLQDDLDQNALPKLTATLRDVNAVMSSSFLDSVALLQSDKMKVSSQFAANIKMHAMDMVNPRWAKHLEWNLRVIERYENIVKAYIQADGEYMKLEGERRKQDYLWEFTVLDCQRTIIAALNGAQGAGGKKVSPLDQAMGLVGTAASIASSVAMFMAL